MSLRNLKGHSLESEMSANMHSCCSEICSSDEGGNDVIKPVPDMERIKLLSEPKALAIISNMRYSQTWRPEVRELMRLRYLKYNTMAAESIMYWMRRDKERSDRIKFFRQYGRS